MILNFMSRQYVLLRYFIKLNLRLDYIRLYRDVLKSFQRVYHESYFLFFFGFYHVMLFFRLYCKFYFNTKVL